MVYDIISIIALVLSFIYVIGFIWFFIHYTIPSYKDDTFKEGVYITLSTFIWPLAIYFLYKWTKNQD